MYSDISLHVPAHEGKTGCKCEKKKILNNVGVAFRKPVFIIL